MRITVDSRKFVAAMKRCEQATFKLVRKLKPDGCTCDDECIRVYGIDCGDSCGCVACHVKREWPCST